MAIPTNFLFALLLLVSSVRISTGDNTAASCLNIGAKPINSDTTHFNRSLFPSGFIFGTATSAYQIEGAAFEGGKDLSIWDTFTNRYPGKIKDKKNGNDAANSYHLYKDDVAMMKKMNVDAYRFSISWPRILPNGTLSGGKNLEGIRYYSNLIDELLANGITPFATLFHWDTPQALEDAYGGFLSDRIANDFRDYAEVCFEEFGDRVKHWITLNEPVTYSSGYDTGKLAPGRCSSSDCLGGDSKTEPYKVAHHLLLAHAEAVRLYKEYFQITQKGKIGITLASLWMLPFSQEEHDQNAAERVLDFMFGWFMDPITNGHYPHSMQSVVGDRLPKFSKYQSKMLKGSFDFVGINYYTSYYAKYEPAPTDEPKSYSIDSLLQYITTFNHDGVQIGPQAGAEWLSVYPRGISDLLTYVKYKYNNPLIYITENGYVEKNRPELPLEKALNDTSRIEYFHCHLHFLQEAINLNGVRVKGYFAWSLLDNFEWNAGYTEGFGFYYVDYDDGFKRYPKFSARWFKNFLKK